MRSAPVVLIGMSLVLFFTATSAQAPDARLDAAAVRAAVENALATAPRTFERLTSPAQAGVRLVDVDVQQDGTAQRIDIDLSQKALTYDPSGDVERLIDHLLAATAPLTAGARDVEYRFLVDGLPLDQFLPRTRQQPSISSPRAIAHGGRVLVSPGHGWYWEPAYNAWALQRPRNWGIVEDLVNWEIATYLWHELRGADLDARPAREIDRTAGPGPSGHPTWQEGAKYFFKALGAPASIWETGANDYNQDINSRPFYANWIDAAALVSIHNNGGEGTGTETWYDETNGQDRESRRLAQIINDHIVGAIRAQYNPAWEDRGLRSCNGCKGENRLASRPAVIVEVAFMDTRNPDNAALHDDRFKRLVAGAIYHALLEWGRVTP
jgi:N-acetylmuramoyl-L-alanine amidase